MTERKFTPPTDFPAEYVTKDGRKATIVLQKEGWKFPYIGVIDGESSWVSWCAIGSHPFRDYRLQDLPTPTLNIPWAHIPAVYRWATMDASGEVWIFTDEPKKDEFDGVWWSPDTAGTELDPQQVMNLNRDGVDWGYSLTKRPEGSANDAE